MTITSIERVEAVLDHKIPDRIPIGLHNFLMACIMHENGVCAEAEAMGCEIRYTQDVPPHVAVPVIQSFDDVDKLTVPDPETTFPLNELIKATRIIVSETRGRVFVNGRSDQGPVALAMALCGPENFLIAAMNPKLKSHIYKLLDICTRMNVALGEAQRRAGTVYEVLTPIRNMSHSAG